MCLSETTPEILTFRRSTDFRRSVLPFGLLAASLAELARRIESAVTRFLRKRCGPCAGSDKRCLRESCLIVDLEPRFDLLRLRLRVRSRKSSDNVSPMALRMGACTCALVGTFVGVRACTFVGAHAGVLMGEFLSSVALCCHSY